MKGVKPEVLVVTGKGTRQTMCVDSPTILFQLGAVLQEMENDKKILKRKKITFGVYEKKSSGDAPYGSRHKKIFRTKSRKQRAEAKRSKNAKSRSYKSKGKEYVKGLGGFVKKERLKSQVGGRR